MTLSPTRLACATVLSLAATTHCLADSIASSASSAGSASIGSLSDSLRGSSNSSTRDDRDNRTAEGDYRIVEVADIAERPGMRRLQLQRTTRHSEDSGQLWLDVPQPLLEQRRLAPGAVIHASRRPYGLEFARADSGEAFLLLLADDWHRELDARPVKL